ncbi:hypothetical protein FNW02_34540 [Komarekiella sp. 'clone 1']|uniref:Uncharacterized protein n=1 Tax=Komarekiella delphini-convector SJRDD-AB1 TaxID=2593771 RepID=A0AA40T4Y0_9NOST|nr:hypothetical protein [Komarekiella delphini-convector]MBD6620743.1 hypothetical protein [Komarekiella delphini-convector SJRDD-AB1]
MQTSLKTLTRLDIVIAWEVKGTHLLLTYYDNYKTLLDLTSPDTSNTLKYTAELYRFQEEEWD